MKRALVLCGGGSLGSYEVGAWKFLREAGLDDFSIVTGTSIGAINGALVVSGEYEKAASLWETIAADKVINHGINITDNVWYSFTKTKLTSLVSLAKSYVKNNGVDISPLLSLMKKAIDPKKVLASKTEFAVTTATFPGLKQYNVDIKKQKEEDVLDWIVASSAVYPIFPIKTIHGKRYVDGGYNDNLPIDLALSMGAEEIVAVLLHAIPKVPQHPELMDLPFVTTIRPSRDTGSIMNFDSMVEVANMTLGYLDAKKTFGKAWGRAFTFTPEETLEPRFRDFVLTMGRENLLSLSKAQKALTYEGVLPKTNRQVYLRAIELLGQWLNMDYLKEYRIDDFIKEALAAIRDNTKKPNIQKFISSHNWGLRISMNERLPFLAYLDYVYTNNLKKNRVHSLVSTQPEILAFIALFDQFKKQGLLQ